VPRVPSEEIVAIGVVPVVGSHGNLVFFGGEGRGLEEEEEEEGRGEMIKTMVTEDGDGGNNITGRRGSSSL